MAQDCECDAVDYGRPRGYVVLDDVDPVTGEAWSSVADPDHEYAGQGNRQERDPD